MALTNPFRATAIFLIESFYEQLWGFKPNFVRPFVKQKGAVRSLFWFVSNTLKYEATLERWGPIHTHVLATAISAINGCEYCTFGHAYALELAYLQKNTGQNTGQLFPLTEHDLIALCGQTEADIVNTLKRALIAANLESEILSLQRMSELYRRPELATTHHDQQLTHFITMFATLNACGMRANIPTDQAHDPVNKNRMMRDRYIALRETERSQSAVAQTTDAQPAGVTVLNPADIATDLY